jgi:hypothetical protein
MSGLEPLLPRAEDRGLEPYSARLRAALGGEDALFEMANLQRFAPGIWRRTRAFLAGLLAEVGLPGQKSDLDVFLGDYRMTPFGIHRDRASNFSVVVAGRKRFLLWPQGYFEARGVRLNRSSPFEALDSREVEPYLADATVLEGAPGDVVYWPSSYWHVAHSDGFAATISVALYVRGPLPALDDRKRLERASADGFAKVPALRAGGFEGRAVLAPGSRMLIERLPAGELVLAIDGHSLVLPEEPELIARLEDLAGGAALDLADLGELAEWLHATSAFSRAL